MLLIGEHMSDKFEIIKTISDKLQTKIYHIDCREILTFKRYGESEEFIRQIFRDAKANGKTKIPIIYLDQLDSLAPNKGSFDSFLIDRVINQLVISIESINCKERALVTASVSKIENLNEMLHSRVKFDMRISIEPPEKEERLSILKSFTNNMKLNEDIDLDTIAMMTEGYGRTELRQLVRIASAHALEQFVIRKYSSDYKTNESANDLDTYRINLEQISNIVLTISMTDFVISLRQFNKGKKHKQTISASPTKWEDLGGYAKTIKEIRETLEWPLKYPNLFKDAGISLPKGILLYGPPGNGKTKIAKAIHCNFPQITFINIKGPELISKWIGESEMAIRETFQQARQNTPSIIFIDEIDSIAPARSSDFDKSEVMNRMVSQMLIEMDGLESLEGVIVIGATNRIDAIDKALLRPGRFDKLFYIAPPNNEDRLEILKVLTKQVKLANDVDLKHIANITEKYNGADLYGLIMEAKKESLRKHIMLCDNNVSIQLKNTFCINNSHIITAKKKLGSRDMSNESPNIDAYG
jgi:transitional endoplasmic reticulum ATPase